MDSKDGHGWHNVFSDHKTTTTITNLTPRTTYLFRLCAVNAEGASPYTSPITVATILGIAAPPTILSSQCLKKSTSESVWLKWEVEEAVEDAILNYQVQVSSMNDKNHTNNQQQQQKWDHNENELIVRDIETKEKELRVYDLLPGEKYSCQVRCQTEYGWSEYSQPVVLTTLPALPILTDTPSIQVIEYSYLTKTLSPFSLGCLIAWSPAKPNGSEIKKYIVQVRSGPRDYSTQIAWTTEDENEIVQNERDDSVGELSLGCRCEVWKAKHIHQDMDSVNSKQEESIDKSLKTVIGKGWVCEYSKSPSKTLSDQQEQQDHPNQARVLLDGEEQFEWIELEDIVPLAFPAQAHVQSSLSFLVHL